MKGNKIGALVVDDETHARELVKGVLGLFESRIEIVGEADNLPDAVRKIQELKPKVVFLDIDMPKFSGLQIKEFITDEVLIVFVTAHGQHAIEALRIKAFDYLLKPLDLDNLQRCVARIELHVEKQEDKASRFVQTNDKKLVVKTQQGMHFVDIDQISFIEAASMYSVIHFQNEQLIVSKPLKEFMHLEDKGFFRTHRSYLVNVRKIKRFSSTYGDEVILVDGVKVPVSRSAKEKFMLFMQGIEPRG